MDRVVRLLLLALGMNISGMGQGGVVGIPQKWTVRQGAASVQPLPRLDQENQSILQKHNMLPGPAGVRAGSGSEAVNQALAEERGLLQKKRSAERRCYQQALQDILSLNPDHFSLIRV